MEMSHTGYLPYRKLAIHEINANSKNWNFRYVNYHYFPQICDSLFCFLFGVADAIILLILKFYFLSRSISFKFTFNSR